MSLTKPRAHQLFDIDYKQSVRVLTDTDIDLSGGAPATVDGVALSTKDRVLVIGQSIASENGLYYVTALGTGANGTWQRSLDADQTGELLAGAIVMVTEGDVYADTQWKLVTNNPIVIGVTELVWESNSAFAFGNVVANGTPILANTVGDTLILTPGDNIEIVGNAAAKSVTIGITGISLNAIANGTSNVNVVSSGGNVTVGIDGTSNAVVFSSTQTTFAGNINPAANVTYDLGSDTQRWRDIWLSNSTIHLGNAQISANTDSIVITNPDGGQTVFSGITPEISATAITASGNITGQNFIGNGAALTGIVATAAPAGNAGEVQFNNGGVIGGSSNFTFDGVSVSVAGNITAAGNISGNYIIGNGSQLTGLPAGYTDANVVSLLAAYGSNSISTTGNISGGNLISLGAVTGNGRALTSLNATNLDTGTVATGIVSGSYTGITGVGTLSAGTWQANSISTTYTDAKVTSVSSSTGISVNSTTGAVTVTNTGVTSAVAGTGVSVSGATGAVTFSIGQAVGTGNSPTFAGLTIPAITKNGSNGVGNIGQSNNTFNTVFARATSALYADLAELYTADAEYAPGTVLVFDGAAEVTQSSKDHDKRIAGVVSTNPAHVMNSSLTAEHTATVALTGRVPCQVVGKIAKGDCLVSSGVPGVATTLNAVQYQPGCVIGKALENYNSTEIGTIEVVVGRL